MAAQFSVGDILELLDSNDADTDCGNLDDLIEAKKVAYIRVRSLDSEGNIRSYDLFDAQHEDIIETVWSYSTRCCTLNQEAFKKVSSMKNTVSAQTFMGKLTVLAKKFLDADTKAVVKAGWLDNCLEVTPLGKEEAMALFFETNMKVLADRARAQEKEMKEEQAK